MKLPQIIMLLFFMGFANQATAYGSSSSTKSCKKPTFSEFTPAHLAEIQPQADFSFVASAITNPKSITVTVKKQLVPIKVNQKNNRYIVIGKLPADIKGSYARINIEATGTNKCKGSDGWLLKIATTEK